MQSYNEMITGKIAIQKVRLEIFKALKEWLIARHDAYATNKDDRYCPEDVMAIKALLPEAIREVVDVNAIYPNEAQTVNFNFTISVPAQGQTAIYETYWRDDISDDISFLEECTEFGSHIIKEEKVLEIYNNLWHKVVMGNDPVLLEIECTLRKYLIDLEVHECEKTRGFVISHLLPLMLKRALTVAS